VPRTCFFVGDLSAANDFQAKAQSKDNPYRNA